MDKWKDFRSRFLYLLLDMQGLTRGPSCSMCTSEMEVKCSDCHGPNYFCTSCCIEAHRRAPYHRTLRWTGTYFAPISLYDLGFVLFLGHHGAPCPLTYEVCTCDIYTLVSQACI